MARIRTVKPEFWIDEKITQEDPWVRLLFLGLLNFADDQGYVDYKPPRIKMQVFPGDDLDVTPMLDRLVHIGVLVPYQSPIGLVLHIRNWEKHQKVDRAALPRFDPEALTPIPHSTSPREPSRAFDEPSTSPRDPSPPTADFVPATVDAEGKGSGSGRDLDLDLEGIASVARPREPHPGPPNPKQHPPQTTPSTTKLLVDEWLAACRKTPPEGVQGQIGKQVITLLAEGVDPADIRQGLAAWQAKGLGPSALPSVVNEVMNASPTRGRPPKASVTDERVNAGLALAAQLKAKANANTSIKARAAKELTA